MIDWKIVNYQTTNRKFIKPFLSRCRRRMIYIYFTNPKTGKRTKITTRTKIWAEAEIVFNKFMNLNRIDDNTIHSAINKKLSNLRDQILFSNSNLKSKSTLSLYKSAFDHIINIIGDKNLVTISRYDADLFMNGLLTNRTKSTVNIYFRHMRAAFNIALSYGYIKDNPFRFLKELATPEETRFVIKSEEIEKLLNVMDMDIMKLITKFGLLTGMRLSEIIFLQWKDIDLEDKIINVKNKTEHETKTRMERMIPLTIEIQKVISQCKPEPEGNVFSLNLDERYVFCKENGFRFSADYISHKFKEYVLKSGINNKICFHMLRHSAATKMSNDSIPLNVLQKILGHTCNSTTMKYLHTDIEKMRYFMEKIDFGF